MSAISTEMYKHIRRIQIRTTHLVEDIFAGAYHSAFKGRGMAFDEVREYQSGDEVRSIDWNVTARMNHPYVKSFKEERELSIMLIVDVSASLDFGSGNRPKRELVAEIAAVLAFSAIKNDDKVGLLLFSSEVEKFIPPAKGIRHVLRVIRELLAFRPRHPGTDISKALEFLEKVQKRFAVCFLISDFMSDRDFSHAMAIAARHYDLIAMGITDPHEIAFPFLGLVTVSDLESGVTALIDSGSAQLQRKFAQRAQETAQQNMRMLKKVGAAFIPITSEDSYVAELQKFFLIRKRGVHS